MEAEGAGEKPLALNSRLQTPAQASDAEEYLRSFSSSKRSKHYRPVPVRPTVGPLELPANTEHGHLTCETLSAQLRQLVQTCHSQLQRELDLLHVQLHRQVQDSHGQLASEVLSGWQTIADRDIAPLNTSVAELRSGFATLERVQEAQRAQDAKEIQDALRTVSGRAEGVAKKEAVALRTELVNFEEKLIQARRANVDSLEATEERLGREIEALRASVEASNPDAGTKSGGPADHRPPLAVPDEAAKLLWLRDELATVKEELGIVQKAMAEHGQKVDARLESQYERLQSMVKAVADSRDKPDVRLDCELERSQRAYARLDYEIERIHGLLKANGADNDRRFAAVEQGCSDLRHGMEEFRGGLLKKLEASDVRHGDSTSAVLVELRAELGGLVGSLAGAVEKLEARIESNADKAKLTEVYEMALQRVTAATAELRQDLGCMRKDLSALCSFDDEDFDDLACSQSPSAGVALLDKATAETRRSGNQQNFIADSSPCLLGSSPLMREKRRHESEAACK